VAACRSIRVPYRLRSSSPLVWPAVARSTARATAGGKSESTPRIIGALGPYEPQHIPAAVVREAKSICGCR